MTKEQFLKNNRGINGDKDLDPEYLGVCAFFPICFGESLSNFFFVNVELRLVIVVVECLILQGIYDRIKTNEIKMNDARSDQGQAVIDPKLRHVSFRRESLALVKKTQQLMQQGASQSSGLSAVEGFFFASPDDASAVKPMFQVLWGPAHGTFRCVISPHFPSMCVSNLYFT